MQTTTSAFVINGKIGQDQMSLQFGLGNGTLNYNNWIQSGYDNVGTGTTTGLLLNPIGGNVGIGTTTLSTTSAKLEVAGNANFVVSGHSDVIGTGTINLGVNTDDFWALRQASTSLGDLTFDRKYAGSWAEAFRIQRSTGNVGIGTTSPGTYKLNVAGTGYYSSQLTVDGFTNNAGISFRNGFDPTNTGIRAKAIATANRDGVELLGYNGIDLSVAGGANVAMRILGGTGANAGNVGIGTTSPNAPLSVASASGTDQAKAQKWQFDSSDSYNLELKQTVTSGVVRWTFDQKNNGTAYPNVMTLDRGNVGIGTTTPGAKLHVESSTSSAYFKLKRAYSGSESALVFGSESLTNYIDSQGASASAAKPFVFKTGTTERMRITNGGNVNVGTNVQVGNPGTKIYGGADAGIIYMFRPVSTVTDIFRFYVGTVKVGSITTNANSTSYAQSSDYRLKEDLQDFNGLDMISNISVYDFKWKVDESRSYGVMAHELQEVLPQAVTGEKDAIEEYEITPAVLDEEGNVSEEAVMGTRDDTQGVDYSKIVPLLVKSIQELKAEIELLKAR